MHDLAVIVVSTNDRDWLRPCLATVFERAGDLRLDVVVADNESVDGTAELVREEFPQARVVPCRNLGFGHANNRGYLTCDARYVLFLNPDTEIREGTLEELVQLLDHRPEIGMAGVKQITADGALYPTIRWFPSAARALGAALGSDRFPSCPRRLREREVDLSVYDSEVACDWVTGSFLLVRHEALAGAGIFDERFFMSSEETDLAYRIKRAGWQVVHLPQMTIVHHVHMGQPLGDRMTAQYAFARRQYAQKNFSRTHRALYLAALRLHHRIRLLAALGRRRSDARTASRRALRTLRGKDPAPYIEPPIAAVAPHEAAPTPELVTSGMENGHFSA